MFTFHEDHECTERPHSIVVFKDGGPITAEQRNTLLLRLNLLGGLDPDDGLWDAAESGSELRVAEMLENHTEPDDVTFTLRRLGGAVIRRLVAKYMGRS